MTLASLICIVTSLTTLIFILKPALTDMLNGKHARITKDNFIWYILAFISLLNAAASQILTVQDPVPNYIFTICFHIILNSLIASIIWGIYRINRNQIVD